MTGAAKMLLIANAKRGGEMRGAYNEMRGAYGGMENEMRGASTSMEAMGHYPPMYNEPESRRRRDSRGRFTSEMDGGEARYEMNGGNARMEAENRRPMQIGFRYEEDAGRYHADVVYPRMNETEHRRSKLEKGHAQGMGGGKMDKRTAEEWLKNLKNVDGSKGPHWTMEQAKTVMEQLGIDCDPLEGWVTMNMLYSDYAEVAKKLGVNNVDFWACMAQAFLEDEDARDGKLMLYYECIAK